MCMAVNQLARSLIGIAITLSVAGATGCDYWPPALQAQIEQLQLEAQVALAERATLQSQLMDVTKLKEELADRVEELTRSNRELSSKVVSLEQALGAERQKVSRLGKSTKPARPAHKSAVKSTPSVKKKGARTTTK